MNSGQKIQFLGIELASFLDKKSNKNFKILILGFELASFLDKNPDHFSECGLFFLFENDASSVSKIRFFKKFANLDSIIRVGFFVQK